MTNFMCNSLNLVIPSKSIVAKSELHFNDNKIPSTFESGVSNLITPTPSFFSYPKCFLAEKNKISI